MVRSAALCQLLSFSLFVLPLCASAQEPAHEPQPAPAAQTPAPPAQPAMLVGTLSREQIEAACPEWVNSEVQAAPDAEAVKTLTSVEPGAEVTVFLGTWCSDSRREVPRLWKALDLAGGEVPFHIRYVGIDRQKKDPAGEAATAGIRFVPTFIVTRNGQELGRIVEQPPHGLEHDLLALLTGQAHGVLSATQPAPPPPSR
jgi:thiol-disulfide isomerase/thioredoxin